MRDSLFTDDEASEELRCAETAYPTSEEIDAVHRAIRVARARGLDLPEPIDIRWRLYGPDMAAGLCRGSTIYLGVGPSIGLELLAKTTLHELAHAHDYTSGRPWDREDWEARAESFAATMMPYWRAGALPSPPPPRTERATPPTTAPRPTSIAPTGSCRARYLLDDARRRLQRLYHRLDGEQARALRVVERHMLELSALARRER